MNEIIKLNDGKISSLNLLKEINYFREQDDNKKDLAHKTLLSIIRDEFEDEINEQKILPVEYKDLKGQMRPMFLLTINEAKQVLVRESKTVRKAVIKRLDMLENSEEQIMANLLLDIYKGGQNAITSSKQLTEIEVRKATAPLKLEIKNKTDVIDDLTSDLDSVVLNKTFTNYCWKVSKRSGIKIQNVYNNVYEIFGRKHNIDLWKRKKTHDLKQVALVEKNKKYNRDNNLRGEDRLTPFNKKDACAELSMVEYICRVLGKGGSLIEVLAKVAEVSIEEIVEKYKMDAKKLGELL